MNALYIFGVYLFGMGFSIPIFERIGWDHAIKKEHAPASLYASFWPAILISYIVVVFPIQLGIKISSAIFSAKKDKNKPTTF